MITDLCFGILCDHLKDEFFIQELERMRNSGNHLCWELKFRNLKAYFLCGLLGFAWCFLVVSLWVILMMSKSTRLGWFDSFGILSRRIFTCLKDFVAWFWLTGNNSFKLDGDGMEASVFRFRYNESLGLSFADSVRLLNNWILNKMFDGSSDKKTLYPLKKKHPPVCIRTS